MGARAVTTTRSVISEVFRDEAGRVVAALVRRFGDFDLAEEATQEAILKALETWPRQGLPVRPGAWLTRVAMRQALNRVDRGRRLEAKLALVAADLQSPSTDDRLQLMLTCCHPALSRDAQVALTLRAVGGFTTAEIARALVLPEATVAQRLVRAKKKIMAAGIPFRIPSADEIGDRIQHVLSVLYLLFNEGQLSTRGNSPQQRDLAEDALWLTEMVCRLLPREPEPVGLLALMKLHLARSDSRFTESGDLILLSEQDRRRWDRRLIREGITLVETAAAMRRPGRYQLEAAIAACHAEAPSFDETDWPQIVALYDMLLVISPSPVIRLNRAVATWRLAGPRAALGELDQLVESLDGYYLFHAVRGHILTELGEQELATGEHLRALEMTSNSAERALLSERLLDAEVL